MDKKNKSSSDTSVEFDDVFQLVNSFGAYQKTVYFGSCFLIPLMAFPFGLMVFGFATPPFQCSKPNITCPQSTCCNNCTAYSFGKPPFTSTVTEWNLVCDDASLNAAIQTCLFVGMLIGGTTSGIVSDAFGRKKCIFIFNGIKMISGFASAFSNSVVLMAVLWFVMGFGLTGLILSHYIYVMEIVGPRDRTMAGNVNSIYWFAGYFIFVLLAYFIREWRILSMITTAPGILLYLFWRIFPESPRWLVANDRLDEANFILLKYGCRKNKTIDNEEVKNLIAKVRRRQMQKQQVTKVANLRMLCRTPKLRKWTATLGCNWFATAFLSNALFLYVTNLSGNIYLNYTIMHVIATLQLPILWFVLKMFGRRIPHAVVLFLIGLQCLLVLAIPINKYPSVKSGLFLGASGIAFSLWTTIYIRTSEIYPTVIRNTAQGTGSTIGRTGGILAPFVAMLARIPGFGVTVPVVIFGVVSLAAAAISLLIPETLFAPMHQTIEEAEAATEDYGIPCCGRHASNLVEADVRYQEGSMMEEDTKL